MDGRSDYGAALDYLLGFTDWRKPVVHRPDAALNLPRMRRLLDLLDAPDARFPAVVVAGTKGKGSTAAILAAVARAGGRRVGLYSQPHLHDYRERVRVDGVPIAPAEVVALTGRLREAVPRLGAHRPDPGQPSTYDLGTALALLHFAARGVELAVLEVGLGGRFDSVNVVTPLVSVITHLSLDHTAVLGGTLERIAAEKAGIIKPGVPVVAQGQEPAAGAVLARTAAEQGAPLHWAEEVVRVAPAAHQPDPLDGRQALSVAVAAGFPAGGAAARRFAATLPLLGGFQRANAATALAAALTLGERHAALRGRLTDDALARGLAGARWPGRLEIVRRSPLTLVDGAHNVASAAALRRALAELFPGRAPIVVLGTSLDKDSAGIARALAPAAARLVLTVSSHPRSTPLDRLREEAGRYATAVDEAPTVGAALDLATALAATAPGAPICATGSLFVVADARAHLGRGGAAVAI